MNSTLAKFGKIGVLYGGESAERAISLRSGDAVLRALKNLQADVIGIDVHFNQQLPQQLASLDTAFIALHGRGGEDGVIQALLEVLGVSYTGSGVTASAIAMDKLKTKWLWSGMGLPTPAFEALTDAKQLQGLLDRMGGAVMVKPPLEGSSIGMSKATSESELIVAYEKAEEHDEQVLVEQWITGKEYTCTLVNGQALPVIRLSTPHQFYDFDAKYNVETTGYLIPSGLTAAAEAELQALSLKAFSALGCTGWGRVDAMQDENGKFWLLEVNTVPGLTDHSLVPMAAHAVGMSFSDLILAILGGEDEQSSPN